MNKIHILPEEVIAKIAAGEVIEKPASVVKELIENSLDAHAKQITVSLQEGGKKSIRIEDDGEGMSPEDAELSIQKHGTSKITTAEDLAKLTTFGFRGEALASVAAIAHLEIITREKMSVEGTRLSLSAGKITEKAVVGASVGTIIHVKDLFFNLPARQKHLKTSETELRSIVELVQRYAQMYPSVGFRVENNGREILRTHPSKERLGTLVHLYGKEIARHLIPIDYQGVHCSLEGFIAKPSLNRADKDLLTIFVNGRFVKHKPFVDAALGAYTNLLNTQRFPVLFLNCSIPPHYLDVNIHPAKITISVLHEKEICSEIISALRTCLHQHDLVPQKQVEAQSSLERNVHGTAPLSPYRQRDVQQTSQQILTQDGSPKLQGTHTELTHSRSPDVLQAPTAALISNQKMSRTAHRSETSLGDADIPNHMEHNRPDQRVSEHLTDPLLSQGVLFRVVGTLHKTYILVEIGEGLRLIDFHAAHERILFEKLTEKYKDEAIKGQSCVVPLIIDVDPSTAIAVTEHHTELVQLGFECEEFGNNSIKITSLPVLMGHQLGIQEFYDTLTQLKQKSFASLGHLKESWLHTMSCRGAKKAGANLEHTEAVQMVRDLLMCKQPHTCPHGRPTMIDFTLHDLEKSFHRVRGHESCTL